MYISTLLTLFLLANAAPTQADMLGVGFLKRATKHAHKVAIKQSATLARDLRTTFASVLIQDATSPSMQNVYCVGSAGNVTIPSPVSNSTGPSNSGKPSGSGNGTSTGTTGNSTSTSSPWKVVQSYSGQNFFNGWSFYTDADPTNGNVQYVDQSTASSNGLLEVNSQGHAVMRVETTPKVSNNRMSVRVTTNQTFTQGLVVMDSVHMPTGCATWPAFWTNGPNWPAGGEIDIVEGVNNYTNNQATIHTNPGCTVPSSLNMTGTSVGGTNCAAAETNNQGCGVRSNQGNSFGSTFNSNSGGVYAMLWTNAGVSVYFFPRGSVPSDITRGAPQPQGWGEPMANWPASGCNPSTFFYDHSAIFDTTLCGDWAGTAWNSTGVPGQSTSCAQQTGYSTCEAFVQNSGASFSEAYWEVASVKIYQTQS